MSQTRGGHGRHAAGAVVVALALLIVALAVAAPSMAASQKVASGDTQLTFAKDQVTALTLKNIAVLPIAPVGFRFQWDNGVKWWFDLPMASGSTFDYTAKKGIFYHDGKLRFVNVNTSPQKSLLMGGLRVIVTNSHTFALSSAVGTAPATRADVFTATNSPLFTRQGKTVKIQGIQFSLTAAGAVALRTALGVDLSGLTVNADLQFKTK
jgi:hypothetical protein